MDLIISDSREMKDFMDFAAPAPTVRCYRSTEPETGTLARFGETPGMASTLQSRHAALRQRKKAAKLGALGHLARAYESTKVSQKRLHHLCISIDRPPPLRGDRPRPGGRKRLNIKSRAALTTDLKMVLEEPPGPKPAGSASRQAKKATSSKALPSPSNLKSQSDSRLSSRSDRLPQRSKKRRKKKGTLWWRVPQLRLARWQRH